MNSLIKFFTDEDGFNIPNELQAWHFVDAGSRDAPRSLCEGQVFGIGESTVKYKTKEIVRGGSNCDTCIMIVKAYKSIKL